MALRDRVQGKGRGKEKDLQNVGEAMAVKKRSPYFDKKETRTIEERRDDQAGELAAMMRLAVKKSPLIAKQIEALGIKPAKRKAWNF